MDTKMNELQTRDHEGGIISVMDEREVLGKHFRIYGDAESPLFLAKDVAGWIEHSNTSKMVKDAELEEHEVVKATIGTLTNSYSALFLTEDGLYEVLMQSRKPIAKEFKRQVKAILKQIRRTGGYIPIAEDESDEIIMARALLIMQKTLEDKDRIIDALLPKAEFADAVAESNNCVTFGEMAKILRQNGLPYGRTRMCDALRRDGFLILQQCADYNTPTQYAMERDIFYHCKHTRDLPHGLQAVTNVVRVTGRGQQVLLQHFTRKQANAGGSIA